MLKQWLILSLSAAGLGGLAWWPVTVNLQVNPPKAETVYVRRVFGQHSVGQTFQTEQTVSAWEVYLRAEQSQTSHVWLTDERGVDQAERLVPLETTDQPVRFWLAQPLPPGRHTLTLATVPETTKEAAVLVRHQPYSQAYDDGEMIIDGQSSPGDVGFRLLARVPVWKALLIFGQVTGKTALRGLGRLLVVAVAGAGLTSMGYMIRRWPRYGVIVLLVSLAVLTVAIRVPYLTMIEGVWGGDAFNYLSKAQALLEGKDPFTADARKGPLYSLLLVPAFFMPDPLMWSRWVGMAAAAGAVVLLVLVLREFKLPWELAAAGGLLLAVNQDFIWESPNGLANTLYVALLLLVVLAFLRRWQWWLAVVLGLVFLTRYEGAVLVPIFWAANWWRERFSWKRAALLLAVTVAIMAVPQVSYIWSGESGIRTAGDVLDDEGLGVARSMEGLRYNIGRFHLFLRNAWLRSETNGGVLPALGVGLLAGAALSALAGWQPVAGALLLAVLLFLLFTKSSEARVWLVAVPFWLMGVGMWPWIRARRFEVGVLLLAVLVHTAVIIQILPKARYFLPLIPFMVISIIFGWQQLLGWNKKATAAVAGALLLAIVLWSDGRNTLQQRAERYNTYAAEVNVMIQAVSYLRGQHGNVGFRDGEQAVMAFIPEKRRFLWQPKAAQEGVDGEREFIIRHKLRYLVERPGQLEWQIVSARPELFEHAHTFDSIYDESKVEVFRVLSERML